MAQRPAGQSLHAPSHSPPSCTQLPVHLLCSFRLHFSTNKMGIVFGEMQEAQLGNKLSTLTLFPALPLNALSSPHRFMHFTFLSKFL